MIADRSVLTDHVGAYRTQSLYLETNRSALEPIMTLKEIDWEHKGVLLPSLHRLYMECNDPTEYKVAMEVFGSWKCWQKQLGNPTIMAYIKDWREELEVELRSKALNALIETSQTEGSRGTAAAKYLADKGWLKRKAGAPSKEEKEGELKNQTEIGKRTAEDFARLGLVRVK